MRCETCCTAARSTSRGAGRWKDPDEDLPGDFEDNRDVHYAALAKPLDAREFIAGLRKRLDDGLTRLGTALAKGTSGGVRIITNQGAPWVSVPKLDKLPEPKNLGALKAEIERRVGHHRPARHLEGHRVHHRLH